LKHTQLEKNRDSAAAAHWLAGNSTSQILEEIPHEKQVFEASINQRKQQKR
jgi:hypothetical protein